MALHFNREEFASRLARVQQQMKKRKLDAVLLFAPESHYWLTGYDTFGFCFFQCLVLMKDGRYILFTRAPDLRQAHHTSIIEDIRIWIDRGEASPVGQLKDLLFDLDLLGSEIGVEYETHGLTGGNGRQLDEALRSFAEVQDVSNLIAPLRLIKSPAEIAYVRKAAALADEAYLAGVEKIRAGANEGDILATLQGTVLAGGGDYPGNEFVIGSGMDALLCRYKSGRRTLAEQDQLTLEFAGVYRHYHVALMRTVIIGQPTHRHIQLHAAACAALDAVEDAMQPGNSFGDVFDAHAREMDARDLLPHRLNACGYSLGARFAPSWMDWPMFYRGNDVAIEPNMVLFTHMLLMDSETNTAMMLGRTYLTRDGAPEPLSALSLELEVR